MSKVEEMAEAFGQLVGVLDRLMGPNGCPWDRKQTLASTRHGAVEEMFELVEAIDLGDKEKIQEEIGDVLHNAIFLAQLGEKEGLFQAAAVIHTLKEKLIRRHPHIFENVGLETTTQALHERWEEIKSSEPGNAHRTRALDGIPKDLPALARAEKVMGKLVKAKYLPKIEPQAPLFASEEDLGEALWKLMREGKASGFHAEDALRKWVSKLERAFRKEESEKEGGK